MSQHRKQPYLIEAFRASRLKGLNPSDYGAETLATQSKSLKGASAAAQASFDATLTPGDDAVHLGSANRANQSQTSEVRHRRAVEKIRSAGIHYATGRERSETFNLSWIRLSHHIPAIAVSRAR